MRSLLRNVLLLTTAAVVAAPLAGAALAQDKANVKVLMIGYPDEDSMDPVTGAAIPGLPNLETAFEAANPDIDLEIISIAWGEGATAYSAKTEAMIQANESCLYEMPVAIANDDHRRVHIAHKVHRVRSHGDCAKSLCDFLRTPRVLAPDRDEPVAGAAPHRIDHAEEISRMVALGSDQPNAHHNLSSRPRFP